MQAGGGYTTNVIKRTRNPDIRVNLLDTECVVTAHGEHSLTSFIN